MSYLQTKVSIALMSIFLAASGQVSAADICKWLDDQGHAHYSDVMPTGHKCLELIRVVQPSSEAQHQAEERRERHQAELRTIENAKVKKHEEAASQSEKEAERERRCQDARAELSFLDEAYGMRLVRPGKEDDADTFNWIDDKEREELIDSWRKEVNRWCSPSSPSSDNPAPERAYGAPPPPRKRKK
jgi:hypothetical protein